jgi:hypothetical protein
LTRSEANPKKEKKCRSKKKQRKTNLKSTVCGPFLLFLLQVEVAVTVGEEEGRSSPAAFFPAARGFR